MMFITGVLAILVTQWAVVSGSLSCDFENNFCDWLQMETDELDWRRSSSETPDRSSGPDRDHTSGSGYYAYMSGSQAGLVNATGGLTSPILIISSEHASLSFWYHMNGVGIGSLSVQLVHQPGGSPITLWEESGRQGVIWKQAKIDLPGGKYILHIVGTAHLHFGSDIAIDDIVFLGYVQEITFPPPTTTEESIHDLSEINCSFEQNFCSWGQVSSDQFDWKRTSTSTPDRTSGPSSDHTTGRGYYAFINGHDIYQTNWMSKLISPRIRVKTQSIFKFWYHMNGEGIGSLSVKEVTGNNSDQLLFRVTGRQGPDWYEAHLDLKPGIYKLVIEATVRLHYGSDIAIDDISVQKHTG